MVPLMFAPPATNMDRTPTSFPPSPPARSPSGDQAIMDASSTYSSPCTASHYIETPVSTVGLGISHCNLGHTSTPSRPLVSQTYPSPTPDWSEHLLPSQRLLDPTLNIGPFPAVTEYELFGRHGVSAAPLNVYYASTGPSTRSYDCPMDAHVNGMVYYNQPPLWMNTPRSDATACSETRYKIKEEPCDGWGEPSADMSHATEASMLMQVPQQTDHRASPPGNQLGDGYDRLAELDPNVDQSRREAQSERPIEVIKKRSETHDEPSNNKRRKVPSASGLQCTYCGSRFTRRSNCHEHMKRHDPSRRKSYPCDHCAKSFGRRTDLRRHVESIHHGIRRFACAECGQRFSRQDTLSRHSSDGCPKRFRRRNNPSGEQTASQVPTQPFMPEFPYRQDQLQQFYPTN